MGEATSPQKEDENAPHSPQPLTTQPSPAPAGDELFPSENETSSAKPFSLDDAFIKEKNSTINSNAMKEDGNLIDEKSSSLEEKPGNSSAVFTTPSAPQVIPPKEDSIVFADEKTKNQTELTKSSSAELVEESTEGHDERSPDNNTISSKKPAVEEKKETTTRSGVFSSQEDLVDAFDDFTPSRKRKRKEASVLTRSEKKISIRLLQSVPAAKEAKSRQSESCIQPTSCGGFPNERWWDEQGDYNYHDDETFMEFFQETHEDQSESYHTFFKQRKDEDLRLALRKLEQQDREGRVAIERIMADQMAEKKQQADRNINKYIQRVQQEEKRDRQKLKGLYQQRLEANQQKVTNSMKILQRRQQKEMQAAAQSHQQRVRQQQISEHIASAEWQSVLYQLQGKQHRQQQEFKKKTDELKKRTDADYSREELKIRNQHETKIRDAEKSRQKLAIKLVSHFQQVRQRYLKRHIQRIVEDRYNLTNGAEENTKKSRDEIEDIKMEEKAQFNPPSPVKSQQEWVEDSPYEPSGAASRHKHRKGVLNQARRQLSVEIHNEGIWVSVMKSEEEDKRGASSQPSLENMKTGGSMAHQEFIPWGTQAHDFLESIVCGEIPTIFELTRSFRDTEAIQGGQVRCIFADLRVSEEVASYQRSVAAREHEELGIGELERKYGELSNIATESERQISLAESEEKECRNAAESTAKDVAKARRCQDEFRSKFRNYLGPDGNPLQTTNQRDRQELMKATIQYKSMLEKAVRREQAISQKLVEIKAKVHKLQNDAKTSLLNATAAAAALKKKMASTSSGQQTVSSQTAKPDNTAYVEKASIRIKDTAEILKRTAEMRRQQAHQKQTTSFNNGEAQMFPELPMCLRKSIWHKMHRRKQQIILRPTEESLINELISVTREMLSSKTDETSTEGSSIPVEDKLRKITAEEKTLLKAEQLFLLAMHPAATEQLSVIPPVKSSDAWGEPGWQLILGVPKEDDYRAHHILPRVQLFPVFEQQYSEIVSAPGRQAASLLKTSHLHCLSFPQSLFATASSPAEPVTTGATQASTYGDPLHLSNDDIKRGYTFSVRQVCPPTNTPAPARRKPQATNERQTPSTGNQKVKKAAATLLPSPINPSVPNTSTAAGSKLLKSKTTTKPQPKKRRPTAVKAPAPTPRTQKKKADTTATGRQPSQAGAMPMVPYPYGQLPPQIPLSQQTSQSTGTHSQQQHQYTPQQMTQFRMMQQQQAQQATGSTQSYQQKPFFPPGLTSQQMQAQQQKTIQPPSQPPPSPKRNPNDNSDPLFMLK